MKRIIHRLLCLALVFTLLLQGCADGGTKSPSPSDKEALNVCIGSEPMTLDPACCDNTADGSLLLHLFEGLYTFGEDGGVVLAQAKSCEIGGGGTVYSFTLRDGLKWSDGKSLSSQDYAYAWNRAATSKDASGNSYLFDVIEREEDGSLSIDTPDDKTLIVFLSSPTPYFTEILALPAFCPVRQDMVEYNPSGWSKKPDSCVGNGAYMLKKVVEDSYIRVEKNEYYYNSTAVRTQAINFTQFSGGEAYDAYFSGEILFADTIPNTKIPEASARDDFYKAPLYGTYYLVFNTDKKHLDNALVREALTLAVDREYVCNEICSGVNTPAGALIPPGFYKNGENKDYRAANGEFIDWGSYEENLVRAKELLEDAGYPGGEGLPVISYTYNAGSGHLLIAEALQHMWAEIGVTLKLVELEWGELLSKAGAGDFQIIRNGWACDFCDPASMMNNFLSDSGRNFSGWTNEAYDELVRSAVSGDSADERADEFFAAEELLFGDWVICPIFYYSDTYLQSKYLSGVIISPLGYKSFVKADIK